MRWSLKKRVHLVIADPLGLDHGPDLDAVEPVDAGHVEPARPAVDAERLQAIGREREGLFGLEPEPRRGQQDQRS